MTEKLDFIDFMKIPTDAEWNRRKKMLTDFNNYFRASGVQFGDRVQVDGVWSSVVIADGCTLKCKPMPKMAGLWHGVKWQIKDWLRR